jgi:hypothetical protein
VSPFGVCRYRLGCNIGSCRGESQHAILTQDATGAIVTALPSPTLPSSEASGKSTGSAGRKVKDAGGRLVDSPLSPRPGSVMPDGALLQRSEYELVVFSPHSRTEEGTLQFITDDDNCVWYNLLLTCRQPPIEQAAMIPILSTAI